MEQIKIHLKNKDDYKNTYNENILSYELGNYILEELKGKSKKSKIEFVVSSNFEMTEEEKNELIFMIRNSFGADISETLNLARKQRMSNYFILLIGVLFILLYTLLDFNFLEEFVLIFGWVFLGEAICNFLYKEIENRYTITRRKQIVNAKVSFE